MGGKAVNPTPSRNIRVDDELWERFGAAVSEMETDRTKWLVEAIRWCLREPGAKMPGRAPA